MPDTGLVYIARVERVMAIPDADRIESLTVNCGSGGAWMGTTLKGDFREGDLCQVYLPDSIVPQTDEFAFMSKYHWRVRQQRLRGVPSEVLIMPQTIAGEVGDDITEVAGVIKYEKPLPTGISGEIINYFPQFIPKTFVDIEFIGIFNVSDPNNIRKLAEGTYPNGKQREGVVIRPMVEQEVNGERLSFKVVNLLYRD